MRSARSPRRVRLSAQPVIHLLPNLITILGLCAGMTSIRYALDERYELAVALICVAGVLDALDGRSARMLKLTSKLGAQLDSLADFLSFGVAPAMLLYLWTLNGVRGFGWALAMLFATCCALRLARFNTELDLPDRPLWSHFFFTGIPAPAGAGVALVPVSLYFVTEAAWLRSWTFVAAVCLFTGVMMVSRIPTYSLKRMRVPPDMVLPVLLVAFLVIAGLITETWLTLSVVGCLYVFSIPFSWWSASRLRRRDAQPAAATTPLGPAAEPVATDTPETPAATAEPSSRDGGRIVSLGRRSERDGST